MNRSPSLTSFLKSFTHYGLRFFDLEPDLLIMLDRYGNIRRVNPAFVAATGRSEADVLGTSIVHLVLDMDLSKFMHAFDLGLPRRWPVFRLLHKDAGEIAVQLIRFDFKYIQIGSHLINEDGLLILRPVNWKDLLSKHG